MVAIACMIENKGAVCSGVGVARAGGPGLPRLHEPRARLGHPRAVRRGVGPGG
jgi:hypothetical protein